MAVERDGALALGPLAQGGDGVFGGAQVSLQRMERREDFCDSLPDRLGAGELGELREVAKRIA